MTKTQIMNLAVKQSLQYPSDERVQSLMTYVLELSRYDTDTDLRDRARFMTALMGLSASSGNDETGPDELTTQTANVVVSEDALAELSDHAKGIMLAPKLPPVTLLGTVDVEGMHNFTVGSLSSLLGHHVTGYEPIPEWPESQPDPTVRDAIVKQNEEGGGGGRRKRGPDNSDDSDREEDLSIFYSKKKDPSSHKGQGSDSDSSSTSTSNSSGSEEEEETGDSETSAQSGDSGSDEEEEEEEVEEESSDASSASSRSIVIQQPLPPKPSPSPSAVPVVKHQGRVKKVAVPRKGTDLLSTSSSPAHKVEASPLDLLSLHPPPSNHPPHYSSAATNISAMSLLDMEDDPPPTKESSSFPFPAADIASLNRTNTVVSIDVDKKFQQQLSLSSTSPLPLPPTSRVDHNHSFISNSITTALPLVMQPGEVLSAPKAVLKPEIAGGLSMSIMFRHIPAAVTSSTSFSTSTSISTGYAVVIHAKNLSDHTIRYLT